MQQEEVLSRPESAPTVSENVFRTRSGRVSKPPVRYEPIEQVEDDYDLDDYDTDDPESDDDPDSDESEEFDDEEEDADEYGNLEGFVVPDKNESSDEDNGRPFPAPVSVVKKRRN
jgi:hypothetical protein